MLDVLTTTRFRKMAVDHIRCWCLWILGDKQNKKGMLTQISAGSYQPIVTIDDISVI